MGKPGIVKDNAELVLKMNREGKSNYEISKKIGCVRSSVRNFLLARGIKSPIKCKVDYDNLLKDKTNTVIQLFEGGMSCNQIGKNLGHSGSQVYTLLNSLGYETPKNIYSVNESYFEKIDTQEKAYILGWFYSDGNVMPDGKIRICLHHQDRDILEWIKKEMEYTGPLYERPARNTSAPQVELCINRKVLADQLIKLGCHPNKSMSLECPSYDIVPKNLFNHFVRGYFDGDGSFSSGAMIVGTLSFTNALSTILPCEVTNIYQRYPDREPEKSSHQLFIGRKVEIKKFVNWLYKGSLIHMVRKHQKVSHLITS